jgi:hypothetical protein
LRPCHIPHGMASRFNCLQFNGTCLGALHKPILPTQTNPAVRFSKTIFLSKGFSIFRIRRSIFALQILDPAQKVIHQKEIWPKNMKLNKYEIKM